MNEIKNYIVLARKYRPKKLLDVVGQDEACKIIEGSVKLNRIAHAFLFSGTRVLSKTTLARILAKIVNCTNLNKDIIEPCGECNNCSSIDSDNNIDVIEIDAASRTGVADVREIIDNINYKPVSAKKFLSLMKFICFQKLHLMLFKDIRGTSSRRNLYFCYNRDRKNTTNNSLTLSEISTQKS